MPDKRAMLHLLVQDVSMFDGDEVLPSAYNVNRNKESLLDPVALFCRGESSQRRDDTVKSVLLFLHRHSFHCRYNCTVTIRFPQKSITLNRTISCFAPVKASSPTYLLE